MTAVMVTDDCIFIAILMFLTQLGAGLAGIALLSCGLSYLDDNVGKNSSAALIGNTRHKLRGTANYRRTQNLG
jgi:hypothetical protein